MEDEMPFYQNFDDTVDHYFIYIDHLSVEDYTDAENVSLTLRAQLKASAYILASIGISPARR